MFFEEEELAFRIGSVQTKAGVAPKSEVLDIATVNVGEGHTLYLQDEITSLDDPSAPETKGSPAFTENVRAVHTAFNVVALDASNTQTATPAFVLDDLNGKTYEFVAGNVWKYNYRERFADVLPAYFFMRMPVAMDGLDLTPASAYNVSDGSISFSYTSPGAVTADNPNFAASAVAQQDILFTSVKKEAGDLDNPEQITFYHALTGVKFANHFHYGATSGAFAAAETIIKSIKISGLKNQGDCVVTPSAGEAAETGKSAAAVKWTFAENPTTATFTQAIDYAFAEYDETLFPEGTLDPAAKDQNLNKNDGSFTFWFIPQNVENVTITIVFDVSLKTFEGGQVVGTPEKTFENMTLTVNLGEKLDAAHCTWKAGELHTFTLWPTAVGVDIKDKMEGDTKSEVEIRNTGNTWNYVRVNIIGNWVGKRVIDAAGNTSGETILMGYADQTGDTETEPWNDKDGYTSYGTFVNLTPKSNTASPIFVNNWVRYDKYYYYTKAIGPNDAITDRIFKSYTVGASPEFWIADLWGTRRLAQDVHLVMDLMVEAIEAPIDAEGNLVYPQTNEDGTPIAPAQLTGYKKAWAQALGLGDNVAGLDDLK